MRRHAHDRAGAVAHQDVVGDPDRDLSLFAGLIANAPVNTPVFSFARSVRSRSRFRGDLLAIIAPPRPCVLPSSDLIDEWIFRREHHVGGAIKRVGPRGENGDWEMRLVRSFRPDRRRESRYRKSDFRAFAASDPVALQWLDRVRPIQTSNSSSGDRQRR